MSAQKIGARYAGENKQPEIVVFEPGSGGCEINRLAVDEATNLIEQLTAAIRFALDKSK